MGLHKFGMTGGAVALPDQGGPLSYTVAAAQGPVRLRYFAPPEQLRAYFGSLYLFTVDADHYADATRADVPQLRFMLTGGGNYHFQDDVVMATPDVCLLGPTMGATRFELDRPSRVVGISLLPAGWQSLHGGDASTLADRLCDLAAVDDADHAELLTQLRLLDESAAEDLAARCWAALGRLVKPLRGTTWALLDAVDNWLMGEGSPRIEALAEATNLSPRQLARLTNKFYGAPPKLLARKYRALRCSARIALDGESWQQLCEEAGFYDQSHCIREIKHFIGLTPHQLQNEPSAVAQLTLLRRSLGSDVAMLNRLS
ncbi:helix-turn-helix domain-containing protein [Sphingobium sp. Ant17]|uniref:helix-turn-helix domain-containing protein n=1 Tax=Sphingobium sp. Ant17 TaxID=1461752 RepID=UPI00044A2B4F|nr:helix-turn-helix domain-containing protein [Sphingobium sp. Ant17]EXS71649.1 AraC family transcriptional regulator [Sphingobium sp. Ant17]|tara:strand:- start:206 stop:1150 length:945 start_codon:yes stop_codon:yes gene_type:complete